MIIREAKGSSGKAQIIIPQDPDDLFTLRRIIDIEDTLIADTTRVIKQVKEYSRPDKGERIRVRILIKVQTVSLDGSVGRLRVGGVIINSDNDLVPKGQHHSVAISVGDIVTLDKNRLWKESELEIVKKSIENSTFILVAIDTQEAAVASVTGTHLKILPNIYSGQSGKRYSGSKKINPNIETFFGEVASAVQTILTNNMTNQNVIMFGPGETKRRFHNFYINQMENSGSNKVRTKIIEGIDVAGEDGIHVSLRSDSLREVMKDTKLGTVSTVLDQIFYLVSKGEPKFAIGMKEVNHACKMKAIQYLLYSDTVFQNATEEEIVLLLNTTEALGARAYGMDSSTDIGLRISSLGGIVALLRYAIR